MRRVRHDLVEHADVADEKHPPARRRLAGFGDNDRHVARALTAAVHPIPGRERGLGAMEAVRRHEIAHRLDDPAGVEKRLDRLRRRADLQEDVRLPDGPGRLFDPWANPGEDVAGFLIGKADIDAQAAVSGRGRADASGERPTGHPGRQDPFVYFAIGVQQHAETIGGAAKVGNGPAKATEPLVAKAFPKDWRRLSRSDQYG